MICMDTLRERVNDIEETTNNWNRMVSENMDVQKASVLIPLLEMNGDIYVLLTRRSSNLRSHSGEVAFPGGKKDDSDANDNETAIRELQEEIGITRNHVEIIGHLPVICSKAGILVTPCIGILKSGFSNDIKLNTKEVESIFYVPLKRFLSSENKSSSMIEWFGRRITLHFFADTYNDTQYTTWGLTATMLVALAVVAYRQNPEFKIEALGDSLFINMLERLSKL